MEGGGGGGGGASLTRRRAHGAQKLNAMGAAISFSISMQCVLGMPILCVSDGICPFPKNGHNPKMCSARVIDGCLFTRVRQIEEMRET